LSYFPIKIETSQQVSLKYNHHS